VRPEIEKVVELIQRKDEKSLEQVLELLQNTIFSFSMKVCGQRQDAEDTMQEVLLKSVPNLPKFDNPRALVVWLYKVAKTRCLMSRRKSKFAPKEALSLDQLIPDRRELQTLSSNRDATPESAMLRRENSKRLREALQRLPSDYRLILVLHDMEDLSDNEIAEITGLRLGTIRVRLHRARLFIRKELAKHATEFERRSAPKTVYPTGTPTRTRRCKELFAELSDYLDDTLDESLCNELEKHLGDCAPCQAFLTDLERSIQHCRTVAKETPDPIEAAKLRREVLSHYEEVLRIAVAGKSATVANSHQRG
jgi:RNA polymerase sigma-70 factor (ECF subfamily)